MQSRVGELDAGEVGLDEHHDRTVAALRLADERVAELQAGRARRRASGGLAAGPHRGACRSGSTARTARRGCRETSAAQGFSARSRICVKVRPGYEAAVAAVLGAAADAVAAENFGAARSAVAALKESDGGRAAIVLGDWPRRRDSTGRTAARRRAVGGRPGRRAVAAARRDDAPCCPASRWCDDLAAALDLVAARPQLRAVTADGDLVGAGWVSGGSDRKPSTLEITSEVEKARGELAAAEKQAGELTRRAVRRAGRAGGPPGRRRAGAGRAQRVRRRDLGDLRAAGQARPGRPRRRRRMAAADPAARRAGGRPQRRPSRSSPNSSSGCTTPQQEPTFDAEPVDRQAVDGRRRGGPRRRGGGAAGGAHRRGTRECRSRTGGFAAPGGGRRTRGPAARAARARGARTRRGGRGGGRRVRASGRAAAERGGRGRVPRPRRAGRRTPAPGERAGRRCASEVNELSAKIAALTDALHRDEVAKAQAALRIEQLEQQVLEQFGMATADLIAEYGPDVPLPPSELEMAEYEQARERGEQVTAPAPMPFDRPTQERRAKKAERELNELGRVNPLGAGGVRGAGGALQLPVHPARGRQGGPQGPARRHRRRRRRASCRCSPRPTPTWNASSARCSRRCSPAARAGCCSPIPTTC